MALRRAVTSRRRPRAMRRAAKKVGLQPEADVEAGIEATESFGNHDLRHSLAAILYGEGMTDEEVSRFLRHGNPNTAKIMYAGMNTKQMDEFAKKFQAIGN